MRTHILLSMQGRDLLHPLTYLQWGKCASAPASVDNAQVVRFSEKLYFGRRYTSNDEDCSILCYDNDDVNSWRFIKSPPTQWPALTTYKGKLVLVGGIEVDTKRPTNKLWSLQDDGSWAELPPMRTPRSHATALSTGHHLLVAGGCGIGKDSGQWKHLMEGDGSDYNLFPRQTII